MISAIHQPHDKLFKLALGDPVVAKEFFKAHLPPKVLKKMDLETLKIEQETFIDESYKKTEADVVYSVKMAGKTAYIYILAEQQTEVDEWLAFRLLGYIIRIMEMHHRKAPKDPLPFVYPLVVYSGDKPWDAPLEIFPLFGEAESLARNHFLKPYQLFDIKRMSDEDLRRQVLWGIVAFALKHQKTLHFERFLKKFIPWIHELEVESQTGAYLSRIVIKYVINRTTKGNQKLLVEEVQRHLSEELKGEVMTIAKQWEQQGVRKGMQKGMQKGMRQGVQKGMQIGEASLLKRQFQRRFGALSSEYAQRIDNASSKTLVEWGDKVLYAESLEDVFN